MTKIIPVTEYDVIFISYDEPNADKHWYDLKSKCPWAKRSHGVFGSDAAHKAAAKLSDTSRFITVDADNVVDPDFFNIHLDMDVVEKHDVISWCAYNEINGLIYGNGGIKCWPVHVVNKMKTHEAADEDDTRAQVDFCWNINYVQMNNVYSHVYNNGSAYQAYRAGFREGCKMTLTNGNLSDNIQEIHRKNYQRLLIWMSVGIDIPNGIWAMYGARLGCYMTNLDSSSWDWKDVRNFEWHTRFWEKNIAPRFQDDMGEWCESTGYCYNKNLLHEELEWLGETLQTELGLEISTLDENACRFFKAAYSNPVRVHEMIKENELRLTI